MRLPLRKGNEFGWPTRGLSSQRDEGPFVFGNCQFHSKSVDEAKQWFGGLQREAGGCKALIPFIASHF